MKKAFTILELVVVLGVISVIIALGSYGIIIFRDSIRIDNAYNDLLSYIQNVQNLAINSSVYPFNAGSFDSSVDEPPTPPEYYAILFGENDFNLFSCSSGASGSLNCNRIELNDLEEYNAKISAGCSAVVFRTSTIDIADANVIDQTNLTATLVFDDTLTECTIEVFDDSSGTRKDLTINFGNNSFNENI
ncbi:MAG: hypothetical protein Kow0081_2290 [Candidatus Dojkabacteria bacterium]